MTPLSLSVFRRWAFRLGLIHRHARCWYCERIFRVPRTAESAYDGWYCPECKR